MDSQSLDTAQTLHIRCGHDIEQGLKLAGFKGDYLAFYDPFCQGPVKDLPIEELIELRSQFAASSYEISLQDAQNRTQQAYNQLQQTGKTNSKHPWNRIVLWFEHDSYDQLILAFLLSYFYRHPPAASLELICVNQVPGVENFIGLGQLSPKQLQYLWEQHRHPVTPSQFFLGEQVWKALCETSPQQLQVFVTEGTPAIPIMRKALSRHLDELAAADTGLSLTETLILTALADNSPLKAGKLFSLYMREYEPLPWLGDAMFWAIAKTLINARTPLIEITERHDEWPLCELEITTTGRQVLAGEINFLSLSQQPRWLGGILISCQSNAV